MDKIYALLYVLAVVMFVLATLKVPHNRLNFLALGLIFWVLVPLIQTVKAM
jgi:hypothetical protein